MSAPTSAPSVSVSVRVGAEVLVDEHFKRLGGRRVGVVLNQASQVHGESLLDVLARSTGVELSAAFAPEHGVRGTAPAGAAVTDVVDERTEVPVYSLYGSTRAPTSDMLASLDVLVFDLQDVGARPYTYLSTMGLAMQAAAHAGIPFVVLDRPNPLGGEQPDGWVLQNGYDSFVGLYPIPLAHGLTAGELARAIQGERWLPGLDRLDLQVVAMEGWQRPNRWADTGLPWIPPSPGLPSAEAAEIYPGTVLFEATSVSVGRGTAEPFSVIGAPWADGEAMAVELNRRQLPGVHFEPVSFVPAPTETVPAPPLQGQNLAGVRIVVDDHGAFRPVATGVHLLEVFGAEAARQGIDSFIARPDTLDALAGTNRLRLALSLGNPAADIIAGWTDEVARFDQLRQPYLLY